MSVCETVWCVREVTAAPAVTRIHGSLADISKVVASSRVDILVASDCCAWSCGASEKRRSRLLG